MSGEEEIILAIGAPPESGLDDEALHEPADPFGPELVAGDPDLGAAGVDPAVVRSVLEGLGDTLALVGDAVTVPVVLEPGALEQWKFTDDELNHLTPIITRMVNARPAWRSAAKRGDEAALALQLGPYLLRNVIAGVVAKAERDEAVNRTEEWERGNVDRQAEGPAPAGDGVAPRVAGGRPDGHGYGDQVGAGIRPPAD